MAAYIFTKATESNRLVCGRQSFAKYKKAFSQRKNTPFKLIFIEINYYYMAFCKYIRFIFAFCK